MTKEIKGRSDLLERCAHFLDRDMAMPNYIGIHKKAYLFSVNLIM